MLSQFCIAFYTNLVYLCNFKMYNQLKIHFCDIISNKAEFWESILILINASGNQLNFYFTTYSKIELRNTMTCICSFKQAISDTHDGTDFDKDKSTF